MTEAAVFRRNVSPPTSTDHDGSDTRKDAPTYQMVPVGGSREMLVRVSGGEVIIFSVDTQVCEFGLDSSPPSTAPANQVVLNHQAETERQLTLHGRSVGRTQLIAVDLRGKILDRLTVSVKSERLVTYNVHCLQDLRRKTTRTLNDLNIIMLTVEKVYLRQANIRLQKVHERPMTFVPEDLGDPIDTGDRSTPVHERKVVKAIENTLERLGMKRQRVNFVSTWNLTSRNQDLLGQTLPVVGGMTCLVEAHDRALEEATTWAHELGHSLGLKHDGHPSFHLMNGTGQSSFMMSGVDIDEINDTGMHFHVAPP